MSAAIRIENLSKRYRLSAAPQGYHTLRETLANSTRWAWDRLRGSAAAPARPNGDGMFWALKDVSFEVQPGEIIGIVGRNGAGKSTLLKILSRITEPTDGSAIVRGRMGSLLEVGTGFHPELTGRENIYLNGAILGMRRKEIDRKFDEIVAFSEVEEFIDTPVKRYSSGMYMRLAFAVAAHLELEILVIDEVLAVGDSAFQKKCLGKMKSVSRSGRTVVFVSHRLNAVEALCDQCLHLKQGRVVQLGPPGEVIQEYLRSAQAAQVEEKNLVNHPFRVPGSQSMMEHVTLHSGDSAQQKEVFLMGEPLFIEVAFRSSFPLRPVLGVIVRDHYESPLFGINNRIIPGYQFNVPQAQGKITCCFDSLPLMPGTYSIDLHLGDQKDDLDAVVEAASFQVERADVFKSGRIPPVIAGPFVVPAKWMVCA